MYFQNTKNKEWEVDLFNLHRPIDENEKINLSQEILPHSPDIRIEIGKLVRFSGENEFSLKIGGTTYEVNTHFSKKGKQSVLEQFKELILSENLI